MRGNQVRKRPACSFPVPGRRSLGLDDPTAIMEGIMKATKAKEPAWKRYYYSHREECIARTMARKRKKAAERKKAKR